MSAATHRYPQRRHDRYMFDIPDLKTALSYKYLTDFVEVDASGIQKMPNLTRKPNAKKVHWLHYVLVTTYNCGTEIMALHIWKSGINITRVYVSDRSSQLIIFERINEGVYKYDNTTYNDPKSGFAIVPVNILFRNGWQMDVEFNDPDRDDDKGCRVLAVYQEFDTKPNEFGQLDEYFQNTRFGKQKVHVG